MKTVKNFAANITIITILAAGFSMPAVAQASSLEPIPSSAQTQSGELALSAYLESVDPINLRVLEELRDLAGTQSNADIKKITSSGKPYNELYDPVLDRVVAASFRAETMATSAITPTPGCGLGTLKIWQRNSLNGDTCSGYAGLGILHGNWGFVYLVEAGDRPIFLTDRNGSNYALFTQGYRYFNNLVQITKLDRY